MKIYKLEYAYDMFIDGRMAEGIHLFSSLDKLFQYAELAYGKKREDFEDCENGTYYCENDVGEWDSETWHVSEVLLDTDLDEILKREEE